MKKIIKIDGMTCDHCVKRATTALNRIDGISDIKVNLKKENATVKLYKEGGMTVNQICEITNVSRASLYRRLSEGNK